MSIFVGRSLDSSRSMFSMSESVASAADYEQALTLRLSEPSQQFLSLQLSIIHQLPAACADTLRELMKRAVDLSAKRLLVHLCADVMLNYANAIEETRR